MSGFMTVTAAAAVWALLEPDGEGQGHRLVRVKVRVRVTHGEGEGEGGRERVVLNGK